MPRFTFLLLLCVALLAAPLAAQNGFTPFEGAIPAEEVTTADLGRDIAIVGTLAKAVPSTSPSTPTRLILADREPNPVMAIFWPEMNDTFLGNRGIPPVGTRISAKGLLSDYQGALQIRLRDASSLRIEGYTRSSGVAPAAATALRPADTTARPPAATSESTTPVPGDDGYFTEADIAAFSELLGQRLSVRGNVAEFRASWNERAPNIVTLADGDSRLEIVFWASSGINADDFADKGTPLYVTGTLQDYRGRLQLRVEDTEDMGTAPLRPGRVASVAPKREVSDANQTWAPALAEPTPRETPTELTPRTIGREHVGMEVTLEGTVQTRVTMENQMVLIIAGDRGFIRANAEAALGTAPPEGTAVSLRGTVIFHPVRRTLEIDVIEVSGTTTSP